MATKGEFLGIENPKVLYGIQRKSYRGLMEDPLNVVQEPEPLTK